MDPGAAHPDGQRFQVFARRRGVPIFTGRIPVVRSVVGHLLHVALWRREWLVDIAWFESLTEAMFGMGPQHHHVEGPFSRSQAAARAAEITGGIARGEWEPRERS